MKNHININSSKFLVFLIILFCCTFQNFSQTTNKRVIKLIQTISVNPDKSGVLSSQSIVPAGELNKIECEKRSVFKGVSKEGWQVQTFPRFRNNNCELNVIYEFTDFKMLKAQFEGIRGNRNNIDKKDYADYLLVENRDDFSIMIHVFANVSATDYQLRGAREIYNQRTIIVNLPQIINYTNNELVDNNLPPNSVKWTFPVSQNKFEYNLEVKGRLKSTKGDSDGCLAGDGFKLTPQLMTIWKNKIQFLNWLRNNQSQTRKKTPLSLSEAQQIIDNACLLNLPVKFTSSGLNGTANIPLWKSIPHFQIENIYIPIQKGIDQCLTFCNLQNPTNNTSSKTTKAKSKTPATTLNFLWHTTEKDFEFAPDGVWEGAYSANHLVLKNGSTITGIYAHSALDSNDLCFQGTIVGKIVSLSKVYGFDKDFSTKVDKYSIRKKKKTEDYNISNMKNFPTWEYSSYKGLTVEDYLKNEPLKGLAQEKMFKVCMDAFENGDLPENVDGNENTGTSNKNEDTSPKKKKKTWSLKDQIDKLKDKIKIN